MSGKDSIRRASVRSRGGRDIRRASARMTPLRAGAILLMLLSGAAAYGLLGTSAFGYDHLDVEGIALTPSDGVETALSLEHGANLVELRTDELVAALRALPTVADAHVSVELPDTVRVRIEERQPILIWATQAGRYLVDRDGLLFASTEDAPAAALVGLTVIKEDRPIGAELDIGSTLDPIDFDVATRLGSLTPTDLASGAAALTVTVEDPVGFVVSSGPDGWRAVFGLYTPTIQPPSLIPGQVEVLRSVLVYQGEANLAEIDLPNDVRATVRRKDGK